MKINYNKKIIDRINNLLKVNIDNPVEINRWSMHVSAFLNTALGPEEADKFLDIKAPNPWDEYSLRSGHLQGLIAKAETQEELTGNNNNPLVKISVDSKSEERNCKVFVVHGRDNEAKESVARFLENLSVKAVVLHEQPSFGRTLIEKFEAYSEDVAFAVILLTPDDIGGLNLEPHELKSRARQNVILELGYFIARLGRLNVCALHKGGVELPSDYEGVVYIEMDNFGAWKAKLAKELVQAKVPIDLSGLIG